MPQHLDKFQASRAADKYSRRALHSSNHHNLPYLAYCGMTGTIITNLNTSQITQIIEKLTIFEP